MVGQDASRSTNVRSELSQSRRELTFNRGQIRRQYSYFRHRGAKPWKATQCLQEPERGSADGDYLHIRPARDRVCISCWLLATRRFEKYSLAQMISSLGKDKIL